ncbi:MAG: hypothetical protein JJE18_04515 [Eubacteriaceae bacterium]|nr:hypothetical protein [Eubacteriaceae bacterium]
MAKVTWIKVSGMWKQVKNVWEKVGGVWKQKVIPKGRVSGIWKDFISYNAIYISYYTEADGYVLQKRDLNYNLITSISISDQAKSIACDKDGNVFLVTGSGIYYYDKELLLIKSIVSTSYESISVNSTGQIMIGSLIGNSFRIYDYNFSALSGTISAPRITGIDSDAFGNFYISMGTDSSTSEKKICKYTSTGVLIWTSNTHTTSTSAKYYKIRVYQEYSFSTYYNGSSYYLQKHDTSGLFIESAVLPYSPREGIAITKNGEVCLLLTDQKYRKYSNDLSTVTIATTAVASSGSNETVQDIAIADNNVIAVAQALNYLYAGRISCYDPVNNAIVWNYSTIGFQHTRVCSTPGNVGAFLANY